MRINLYGLKDVNFASRRLASILLAASLVGRAETKLRSQLVAELAADTPQDSQSRV